MPPEIEFPTISSLLKDYRRAIDERDELAAALERSLHCLTEGDETMWRHPESPYHFIGSLLTRIKKGSGK